MQQHDLLTQAVESVRLLLDRQQPLKVRVRLLWAAIKNARGCAASDVIESEFFHLARDAGLVTELDDPIRRLSGEDTVGHVLSWGLRGLNPFESGPLE
jgi:hypothetical protein